MFPRPCPTVLPVRLTATAPGATVLTASVARAPVALVIPARRVCASRRTTARIATTGNSATTEPVEPVPTEARAIPTTIFARQAKCLALPGLPYARGLATRPLARAAAPVRFATAAEPAIRAVPVPHANPPETVRLGRFHVPPVPQFVARTPTRLPERAVARTWFAMAAEVAWLAMPAPRVNPPMVARLGRFHVPPVPQSVRKTLINPPEQTVAPIWSATALAVAAVARRVLPANPAMFARPESFPAQQVPQFVRKTPTRLPERAVARTWFAMALVVAAVARRVPPANPAMVVGPESFPAPRVPQFVARTPTRLPERAVARTWFAMALEPAIRVLPTFPANPAISVRPAQHLVPVEAHNARATVARLPARTAAAACTATEAEVAIVRAVPVNPAISARPAVILAPLVPRFAWTTATRLSTRAVVPA
jgi:hypothetical protein